MSLIQLRGISRTYGAGEHLVHALHPSDLDFDAGRFTAIIGASGSGKSTLMNILGLLDPPTTGVYRLEGQDVAHLTDAARSAIRGRKIGIVFQSFNLLPHLDIRENVCIPMRYAGVRKRDMRDRASELLTRLGLGNRLHHRPTQLSGGQCQRVAIARALANDPPVILADEPTGNLDEPTGREVIRIFQELAAAARTIIMITHNPDYETAVQRVIELHDGRVVRA
ncbi:MAG: ABC transporter ATP-binding protein [Lentisphaeria bacterium]